MGPDAVVLVFWMLSFKPTFSTLLFHFHQEALYFLFTFCHKGSVICISEVIDTSPGNLDSSLCFVQPSISHDSNTGVSCHFLLQCMKVESESEVAQSCLRPCLRLLKYFKCLLKVKVSHGLMSPYFSPYFPIHKYMYKWASQVALVVKNLCANTGDIRDVRLIPGSRKLPGGRHGNPFQYSNLKYTAW